jgi:hypothetical protein
MPQLVKILFGPTYQADMLKDALAQRDIIAVVQPASGITAYGSLASGANYSNVLVSEDVLRECEADVMECLELVGGLDEEEVDYEEGVQ